MKKEPNNKLMAKGTTKGRQRLQQQASCNEIQMAGAESSKPELKNLQSQRLSG
jgi:hypothetical protein